MQSVTFAQAVSKTSRLTEKTPAFIVVMSHSDALVIGVIAAHFDASKFAVS